MKSPETMKIDLLAYQTEAEQQKKKGYTEVLLLCLVAVLLMGAAAGFYYQRGQELKALQEEKQVLQTEVDDLKKVEVISTGADGTTSRQVGNLKTIVAKLEKERKVDPQRLLDIYLLTVPKVTISMMEFKKDGNLVINAYTSRQSNMIEFVDNLKTKEYIKDIKVINSKLNGKTGEVTFTLDLVWEVE